MHKIYYKKYKLILMILINKQKMINKILKKNKMKY